MDLEQQQQEGRRDGVRWAREYANADELADVGRVTTHSVRFERPHSLCRFESDRMGEEIISVTLDPGRYPWAAGFVEGVAEAQANV